MKNNLICMNKNFDSLKVVNHLRVVFMDQTVGAVGANKWAYWGHFGCYTALDQTKK